MTLRDWVEYRRQRLAEMERNRDQDALVIASDLIAQVQLRIQTSGINYQGLAFTPYSEGHKRRRVKAGAQNTYVDFTITGQMWRNIRPEVVRSDASSTTVQITARDQLNQNKLRGAVNSPKRGPRGNILIPSDEEIQLANIANRDRVIRYLTT